MKTTPTRDASDARSSRSVKVSPRKRWAKRPVRAGVRNVRVVESDSLVDRKMGDGSRKAGRKRRGFQLELMQRSALVHLQRELASLLLHQHHRKHSLSRWETTHVMYPNE